MRGFGFGYGKARFLASASGPVYSPEATAYFAAMSVQPDATRKGLLATAIDAIYASGAWAILDGLTISAMHDEQAARVDARNPARVATVGVAPTFVADRGYTSNGTSQYLNSGFNPSTAGGQFTQNAASMGVWCGTDVNSGPQYELGNSNATIGARTGTTLQTTPQSAAATNFAGGAATSVGLSAWSRTGATSVSGYKNGTLLGSTSSTSTALRNASFLFCAVNSSTTGTVTPGNYTTRRFQAAYFGGNLTTAHHLAIYNALAEYFAAIGA